MLSRQIRFRILKGTGHVVLREIANDRAQPSTRASRMRSAGLAPGSGAPHALRLTHRIRRLGITYASYSNKR